MHYGASLDIWHVMPGHVEKGSVFRQETVEHLEFKIQYVIILVKIKLAHE